jgi:hypothetical protein
MRHIETMDALRDLASAASRLADLLVPLVIETLQPDEGWQSPTRDLEPIVVLGEEDLPGALRRGHGAIVHAGAGGFQAPVLSADGRIRHLAVALVGDVALEAAHSGVSGSGIAVDAMLARGLAVLSAAAVESGVGAPAEVFLGAAQRFLELDARGAQWR